MTEFPEHKKKCHKPTDWELYDLLEITLIDLPGDFGVIRYPGIKDSVFIFDKDKLYIEDRKITFEELRGVWTVPRKWVDFVREKLNGSKN